MNKFIKLIVLVFLWAIVWYFVHGEIYEQFLNSQFDSSTAFILFIVISFVSVVVFQIAFLAFIIKKEKVKSFRSFFKIETLDIKGIWLCLGLGLIMQVINAAFLFKLLLEPARNFLISLGISGQKIGLGSGEMVPLLSSSQAIFLTVFLLLFWWVEIPEELFFRGYIQNKLQDIVGKNIAMFLSALIWDISHLWGLINILERFFYGLIYALVFRSRQNTTAPMIVHPIGNRSLLLAVIIPQIWGRKLDTVPTMLFTLFLYITLILLVIIGWRILKLDRK